ncbi:hypothetical protein BLOT_000127 [Blomia tropicalis]|nr:hypothetical protein BLOT_000127 [Blomia tropicalis]
MIVRWRIYGRTYGVKGKSYDKQVSGVDAHRKQLTIGRRVNSGTIISWVIHKICAKFVYSWFDWVLVLSLSAPRRPRQSQIPAMVEFILSGENRQHHQTVKPKPKPTKQSLLHLVVESIS